MMNSAIMGGADQIEPSVRKPSAVARSLQRATLAPASPDDAPFPVDDARRPDQLVALVVARRHALREDDVIAAEIGGLGVVELLPRRHEGAPVKLAAGLLHRLSEHVG